MSNSQTSNWFWRWPEGIIPFTKKWLWLYHWNLFIGPYISFSNYCGVKGWRFGFAFYFFAFNIAFRSPDIYSLRLFTGLQVYWTPTQWLPHRLKEGELFWRNTFKKEF